MAMIICKGCGKEISSNAKVCPECGEPAPKKTSMITWLVLILFIFIFINSLNLSSTSSHSEKTEDNIKKRAINLVEIVDYERVNSGLDNILEMNFTIKNNYKLKIKDIEITCTHYAKSGTKIDNNKRIIYDVIDAGSQKTFSKFNMGLIHTQADETKCKITDLEI